MEPSSYSPAHALPLREFTFQTVTLNHKGEINEQREGRAYQYLENLDGGVILPLVAIPGGTFQMGSAHGQGYEDETPRHLVSVAPFLLGRYPVTQAQWQAVMRRPARGRFQGEELPVERISWKDAAEFCRRLAGKTGRPYGLPSEAQWEYACRAGRAAPFSTGETITTGFANYCGDHIYLEEPRGVYRHVTTPGSMFPPNGFGVSDMHGNLWEFCADRWHPDYAGAPFDDGSWEWGGEQGYRVARGGSWHEPPVNCRCATRLRVNEKEADDLYGFRVMLKMEWNASSNVEAV